MEGKKGNERLVFHRLQDMQRFSGAVAGFDADQKKAHEFLTVVDADEGIGKVFGNKQIKQHDPLRPHA